MRYIHGVSAWFATLMLLFYGLPASGYVVIHWPLSNPSKMTPKSERAKADPRAPSPCGDLLMTLENYQTDYGFTLGDHRRTRSAIEDHIWDVYGQRGPFTSEQIQQVKLEEAEILPSDMIHLELYDDETNKPLGALRLVSGRQGKPFNFFLSVPRKRVFPATELERRYSGDSFTDIWQRYPSAIVMGRFAPMEPSYAFQVMLNLGPLAIMMARPFNQASPKTVLQAESASKTTRGMFETLGIPKMHQLGSDPERWLHVRKAEELYQIYVRPFDEAYRNYEQRRLSYLWDPEAIRAYAKGVEDGLKGIPDLARSRYLWGIYHLARAHFLLGDFKALNQDLRRYRHWKGSRQINRLRLHARVGEHFNWVTGEGDAKAALKALQAMRQANEIGPLTLQMREYYDWFVEGMIHLRSGDLVGARAIKEKLEDFRLAALTDSKMRGRTHKLACIEEHGVHRVDSLKRNFYDPESSAGEPELALDAVNWYLRENPLGLSVFMYNYKAQILRTLDRVPEAIEAEKIANALKISSRCD